MAVLKVDTLDGKKNEPMSSFLRNIKLNSKKSEFNKMNCPSCEMQVAERQQFCRSCGFELAGDAPRRIPRAFWALSLAFAGILLSLIGSMIAIKPLVFTGVIMTVLGIFSIAAISMLSQGRRRSRRIDKRPESLPTADTTNKLPPMSAVDHFPSVTENTTNLLSTPASKTPQSHSK